jgi:hypothetical protein
MAVTRLPGLANRLDAGDEQAQTVSLRYSCSRSSTSERPCFDGDARKACRMGVESPCRARLREDPRACILTRLAQLDQNSAATVFLP